MESRMEKYYRENPEYYKRSKRNVNLYKDIDNDINDLDNLPIPDNSNEIDINGLKQFISSRDEYRKAKDMGRTITRKRVEEEPREEKRRVYDINVLLETAKNEVNKNLDEFEKSIQRQTETKNAKEKQLSRFEIKKEQLENERKNLYNNMWEEYEITYVVAKNYERLNMSSEDLVKEERNL